MTTSSLKSAQPNVLCVTDYYLPGFRGGGPIRTIENMRQQLVGKVNISIFTRDRDLNSDDPYPDIKANEWLNTQSGQIYYATPDIFGSRGLRDAIAGRKIDIIYLNSFFSYSASISIQLDLFWNKRDIKVLLAPRGEFSSSALGIKKVRKWMFISLARLLGLYENIMWHASTEFEKADILRQFPNATSRILVASDPIGTAPSVESPSYRQKKIGHLRIVFISRISPMKNLDGLINILSDIDASVDLNIFGPIEETSYWNTCQEKISSLPNNIQVSYHGPLPPEMVLLTFSEYDIFVFPTLGENFGHVIFEALRAGTPVITSDRTPWQSDKSDALKVIALENITEWRKAILAAANRNQDEQVAVRTAALNFAEQYVRDFGLDEANLAMFRRILNTK